MICLAQPHDRPGMTALWQDAFGDPIEYINLFFDYRMKWENTILFKKNHTVIGQLFILPCQLSCQGKTYSCGYIYGVATLKTYRGQGVSSLLLEYAHKLLSERGYDVAVLVPASRSLFDFYSKRDYSIQGYIHADIVGADSLEGENAPLILSPVSAEGILQLREEYFGKSYLKWDLPAIQYILKENRFLGGQFYGFSMDGQQGFAACVPFEDKLMIKELACPDFMIHEVLKKLHIIYNKDRYIVWLSNTSKRGKEFPAAMCHWLKQPAATEPFYLSHILD